MSQGCMIGRRLQYVVGEALADAAAFQALAVNDPRRVDGCVTVKLDDYTVWMFQLSGTAPAGSQIIEPTTGTGQWSPTPGGSQGEGIVNMMAVRGATTANIANLASFTVAGVDGLTYLEDERLLVKDQTASEANGPYQCGVVAGGTCALTRVGEADASIEVTAGMLVYVSEGTAAGNEWWYCSADDDVVLGTTSLAFIQTPSAVDVASIDTRISNTEDDISDLVLVDSSIELIADSNASSVVSIDTRVSDTEDDISDLVLVDSSIELIADSNASSVVSIDTRVSNTEDDISDLVLVDSSIELIADSNASSVVSIDTRVSNTEDDISDLVLVDSSIELIADSNASSVVSIDTRVSNTEDDISDLVVVDSSIELIADSNASSVISLTTRVSVEETVFALLRTVTLTSADLTTAGVGPETENIGAVLSDDMVPMMVRCKLTDAFDNGIGVSLVMTVGWSGVINRFVTAFDCYTGSALENSLWESGTRNAEPQFGFPPDSTQMVAGLTAGADQLNNFTNGSVTIEVWGISHS